MKSEADPSQMRGVSWISNDSCARSDYLKQSSSETPEAIKTPLLVFADDWGRHPSSCQHLIRRLRADYPVLWVNTVGTRQVKADSFTLRRGLEKMKSWSQGLRQVDRQMWTLDVPMLPGMSNHLLREMNRLLVVTRLRGVLSSLGMELPVVLTTLPYVGWLIRGLRRRGLVYYCTDDYSHWPSADRETLQRAERELTREADLILAASHALQLRHAETGRCEYFPHGVDYHHFATVQQLNDSDPILALLPRPRIGFFGLIYEKLDFQLLADVAKHFRHGSLVLIGPRAYSPIEFDQLSNVHFLGQKRYEELPRYLAGLDVLLLPYVNDDMIRQSGPLKLRECLASGKPTVSIDVPDVRMLQPHVRVASDRQGFVSEIHEALEETKTSAEVYARQKVVEMDSWDNRARQLDDYLSQFQTKQGLRTRHRVNKKKRLGRVLHLRTVSGRGGGPEKTILNSPSFLKGNYEMRLVYIRPHGDPEYDMVYRAKNIGVDLVDIPERGGFDPRTLWRVFREIQKFQPDIIHAHDYKTNILAVLLGRLFGARTMTTMHGYVSRGGRLEAYYRLDRWALPHMDYVITVSDDLNQMLHSLGIPKKQRSFVPNAIDHHQFTRHRSNEVARKKLGLHPSEFIIGGVGRLAAEKGFHLLVHAVDQLIHAGANVKLVIVGEGDERPKLEAIISRLGRNNCIELCGHRSDVRDLYEAFDVFALSSLREGLPNVLLEAMALEVPVVATRIAGVPGLIEHEKNGLLIQPGSVDELTAALERLLRDAELRQRLAKAGRETIVSRYSFATRMRKIQAIYDQLLGRGGSSC
jgi:glycosyltransferase involved in cell wall biosynthesis